MRLSLTAGPEINLLLLLLLLVTNPAAAVPDFDIALMLEMKCRPTSFEPPNLEKITLPAVVVQLLLLLLLLLFPPDRLLKDMIFFV